MEGEDGVFTDYRTKLRFKIYKKTNTSTYSTALVKDKMVKEESNGLEDGEDKYTPNEK